MPHSWMLRIGSLLMYPASILWMFKKKEGKKKGMPHQAVALPSKKNNLDPVSLAVQRGTLPRGSLDGILPCLAGDFPIVCIGHVSPFVSHSHFGTPHAPGSPPIDPPFCPLASPVRTPSSFKKKRPDP